jgi:hypothetical protein
METVIFTLDNIIESVGFIEGIKKEEKEQLYIEQYRRIRRIFTLDIIIGNERARLLVCLDELFHRLDRTKD